MTHAGQSVVRPSGFSNWLQNGHMTQAEPIRVPPLIDWLIDWLIWAKGSGKAGDLDGAVCSPTYPQPQPHGEPFLKRREGGSTYKKAPESRFKLGERKGGREIWSPRCLWVPHLWDLGVLWVSKSIFGGLGWFNLSSLQNRRGLTQANSLQEMHKELQETITGDLVTSTGWRRVSRNEQDV